jgi:hypothetical protein
MASYMFAYHGGRPPKSPEEGAKFKARWRAWVGELGKAMTEPGVMLGKSSTVSAGGVSDDGGPNPLSGFSIVTADSIEAALEMARQCPHVEHGTIEVAEVRQMPS